MVEKPPHVDHLEPDQNNLDQLLQAIWVSGMMGAKRYKIKDVPFDFLISPDLLLYAISFHGSNFHSSGSKTCEGRKEETTCRAGRSSEEGDHLQRRQKVRRKKKKKTKRSCQWRRTCGRVKSQ